MRGGSQQDGPAVPNRKQIMQLPYFSFGINDAGTTLVIKLVHPRANPENVYAPEFWLTELDRRGMHEFCRIFGRYTLDSLRIFHPAVIGHYPLFPPEGTRVIADGPLMTQGTPMERGAMRARRLDIGIAGNGLALEYQEFENDQPLVPPRCLELTKLAALGPNASAMSVANCILTALLRLHPEVFAPLRHLSHPPEKEDDRE
jgi:hypothetical protein